MEPTAKPLQTPGFLLEELDGELMLYSVATTRILALNQSAALIWRLCSGHYTIHEIAAALGDTYPEHTSQIRRQVEELLTLLLANGAIELC